LEDAKILLLSAAGYSLAATLKAKSHCFPQCTSVIDQNPVYTSFLLERDETRRVGSTNTRSSVLDRSAADSLASSIMMIQIGRHTKRSRTLPNNVQPSPA